MIFELYRTFAHDFIYAVGVFCCFLLGKFSVDLARSVRAQLRKERRRDG